jgi:transposase
MFAHARHAPGGVVLMKTFINKIKHCRRIAIRYDKLAANYLAFIKLASIRIWLRAYESMP